MLQLWSCDQSVVTLAFISEKLPQSQFYKGLTKKKHFFVGWSCFKFSNLGLVLCIALKFYTSLEKGLKHKVRSYVSKSYTGITGREEGCVHGVLVKLNFV